MFSVRLTLRRLGASAGRRLRAFGRDQAGVTAVEFGILALPFFTLILAILQTAVMFLATQVLDSAVEDASRRVRTGEAAEFSLDQFRNYMCDYTFGLFGDCSGIKIKTQVITDFADIDTSVPETCGTETCTWDNAWEGFDPGTGRSVMQVSAYYRYPLLVVLPYFNLKNQPDNFRLISAIRVFRNEPFSGGS